MLIIEQATPLDAEEILALQKLAYISEAETLVFMEKINGKT
jgi:hypothetical protein